MNLIAVVTDLLHTGTYDELEDGIDNMRMNEIIEVLDEGIVYRKTEEGLQPVYSRI